MKKAEDNNDAHMFARLVSDDDKIEMGIHPVLFGYRVVAGKINDQFFNINWCGGDDQSQVEMLYSIAKNILEHKKGFDGVPMASAIKPFYKDEAFMKHINSLVTQPLEVVKLEQLGSYKTKQTNLLGRTFDFD